MVCGNEDSRHANLRNTIKNARYKREERKKSGQNTIATRGMGIGTMKQINDHDSDQAEEAHGIQVNFRIADTPALFPLLRPGSHRAQASSCNQ